MDETSSSFFGVSCAATAFRKNRRLWPAGLRLRLMRARKFLFSQQHEEGYWCGELEADTTLESDYILLHTLLARAIRSASRSAQLDPQHQNEDGGWGIYGRPIEHVGASVKAILV